MAIFHMSAPWVIFYRELEELFKYDPQVHVVYDEADNHVKLYVDDADKAIALDILLPHTKVFGSVSMSISVIPANTTERDFAATNRDELFRVAFRGNGAFSFAKTVTGIFVNNLTYIVFRNRVVQYFNDDLGDIYGQCSTLYQEIAKNVFGETEGIFFCTDAEQPIVFVDNDKGCELCEAIGSPLGEWP